MYALPSGAGGMRGGKRSGQVTRPSDCHVRLASREIETASLCTERMVCRSSAATPYVWLMPWSGMARGATVSPPPRVNVTAGVPSVGQHGGDGGGGGRGG